MIQHIDALKGISILNISRSFGLIFCVSKSSYDSVNDCIDFYNRKLFTYFLDDLTALDYDSIDVYRNGINMYDSINDTNNEIDYAKTKIEYPKKLLDLIKFYINKTNNEKLTNIKFEKNMLIDIERNLKKELKKNLI